jgi:Dyp-type peroxidase family
MTELSPENLRDIQGFILTGYNHQRFAVYLFLEVRERRKAWKWLEQVLPQVTSAARWPKDERGRTIKPAASVNIAFTWPGLAAWGLSERVLYSFVREYVLGASRRSRTLGDFGESAPEHWETGGPNNPPVHVMVRISAVDEEGLAQAVRHQEELLEATGGGVVEVHREEGARNDLDREPFGFRDGISNPLIEGTPGNPVPNQWVVRTGEFILGYLNQFDLYPESPTVPVSEDPYNLLPSFPDGALPDCHDLGRNGSYLVYRKLKQDVQGFWAFAEENARRRDGTVEDHEAIKTASKMVGRWPSGAPMVLAPNRDEPDLADDNRFTYESDPHGFACPIGSHLRRANPRASFARDTPEESFKKSNRHRILRRATNWGEPLQVEADYRTEIVAGGSPCGALQVKDAPDGIHFFAVNADFARQFELVQQTWLNAPGFNGLFDNPDPVVGDNDGSGQMTVPRNPIRQQLLHLPRFVTVRAGLYLFLPSLTALRFLATGTAAEARGDEAVEVVDTVAVRPARGRSGRGASLLGLLFSLLSFKLWGKI